MEIRPRENIVIYTDTATNPRVFQTTSAAAHTIGAKVTTVWHETNGDIDLPPPEPVEAAMMAADMIIEFAVANLVHSAVWLKARQKGIELKCLTRMNADIMVRTLDPELYFKIEEFMVAYFEVLSKAKSGYRITSPAGTDITIKALTPDRVRKRVMRRIAEK